MISKHPIGLLIPSIQAHDSLTLSHRRFASQGHHVTDSGGSQSLYLSTEIGHHYLSHDRALAASYAWNRMRYGDGERRAST